jgi:long-chain acyl-CoA synthetase
MSEIIVCAMNPPGGIRAGTIGQAFSRVELKVGDDGELFARGPNMFTGYRNDPERTAAALVDGWVQTGDLAEIDAEGYVRIVGRKKEIMINSAGKNLTPLTIEAAARWSHH